MKKLFLFVVLLLATIYHSSSQVDMSRKIVLTTSSGATLDLRFRAAANMTPIKLQNQYDRPVELNVGSSWSEPYTISAGNGNQVTIYGNIDGLDCTGNSDYPEFGVQAIDIQANSNLKVLYCEYNTISKLDFANATQIQEVYCQNNRINSINIRGCNNLNKLVCYYNQFTTLDLDTLYCALPQGTPARLFAIYPLNYPSDDAAIITATNAQNARDKFWAVRYYFSGDNNNEEIQTTGNYQCQGSSPNLNKYITLSLNPQANVYYFKIKAATPNTPIRVVYGNETRDLSIGTDWSFQEYPGGLSEIKIYGDVVGLNIGTGNNNDMFTNVNLSNNSDLEELLCANAGLSTLDVTNSTKLKKLHCQNNRLTGLNIRNNTQLEEVAFFGNQFTTFTVDTIYCALRQIPAGTTQGKCYPALSETSETTADIRATNAQNARNKNWQVLYYSANTTGANGIQTTGTYVCGSPEPSVNMSKYITVTLNPQAPDYRVKIKAANANTLVRFVRGNNTENATIGTDWFTKGFPGGDSELKIYGDITGLDINGGNNVMTALDLTHNSDLEELLCPKTGLSTLDVSNSTKLKKLHCQDNRLTGLNIRNNNQLSELVLYGNQFSKYTIDTIYCALPNASATQSKVIYPLNSIGDTDNEMVLTTNANNATNKGWKVKYYYGGSSDEMNIQTTGTYACGSPEPSVNMSKYIMLSLNSTSNHYYFQLKAAAPNTLVRVVYGNETRDLSIGTNWTFQEYPGGLSEMKIYGDVIGLNTESSNNYDMIKNIDLTHNSDLEELLCPKTGLSTLDVTNSTKLKKLHCQDNRLTGLNIRNNTQLEEVAFFGNQFTTFTVDTIYCALRQIPAGTTQGKCYPALSQTSETTADIRATNAQNAINKNWQVLYYENTPAPYIQTTGTYICGSPEPSVNMSKYITLSLNPQANFYHFEIKAAAPNTLVRVVYGNETRDLYIGTNWSFQKYHGGLSEMKIYGDVIGLNTESSNNYDMITNIDLTHNSDLEELLCPKTGLSTLDVSNSTKLKKLHCQDNRLTGLNIRNNNQLSELVLYGNQFSKYTIDTIYCALPNASATQSKVIYPLNSIGDTDNEMVLTTNANNATNKGWKVKYYYGGSSDEMNIQTTGTYICGSPEPSVNMSKYITITLNPQAPEYRVKIKAANANTLVRFVRGNNTENATIGTDWFTKGFLGEDSELKIYGDITGLDINGGDGEMTALDLTHNSDLEELLCASAGLSTLDVSNNTQLTKLDCSFNELTSLDVSKNTQLTKLPCNGNQLTSLDVSKNTQLTYLSCGHNQLTSLDVSKNTQLTYLSCGRNQLTSLDVSKNTQLTYLSCDDNQLTSLEVSKNTQLTYLYCDYNQLTSLDVSKNTQLTELLCYVNKFTTESMNELYCSLPDRQGREKGAIYPLHRKDDANHKTIAAATSDNARNKNWSVKYNYSKEKVPSNGNYDCNSGVDENLSSGISVFPNPASGKVQIKLSESVNETMILVDLAGRAVLLEDVISGEATIDVSNLTAGTYFIKVGNITKKLTVK